MSFDYIYENNITNTIYPLPFIQDVEADNKKLPNYNCYLLDFEINYAYSLKLISNNIIRDPPYLNCQDSNENNLLNFEPKSKFENKKEEEINIEIPKQITSFSSSMILSTFSSISNTKSLKKVFKTKQFKKKNKELSILVAKKGKRGRKTNNIKEVNSHTANDVDNILVKIQADFLNFIINISNDAIFTEFGKIHYNFKKISYAIKKNVNYQFFKKLQSYSIKNVLGFEISDKYKSKEKNINKNILDKVCKKSIWLSNFFDQNYLEFFGYYYNNGKHIDKIHFKNKVIIKSNQTKSFYDLLLKYEKQKENLINTVKNSYLTSYDHEVNKNIFRISQILF